MHSHPDRKWHGQAGLQALSSSHQVQCEPRRYSPVVGARDGQADGRHVAVADCFDLFGADVINETIEFTEQAIQACHNFEGLMRAVILVKPTTSAKMNVASSS